MSIIGRVLAILCASWLSAGYCFALSVDEIIKLKQAGVADSTIELLIKSGDDSRSTGLWKQDGWIVHSTPPSEASYEYDPRYYGYPMIVVPRPIVRRHHR